MTEQDQKTDTPDTDTQDTDTADTHTPDTHTPDTDTPDTGPRPRTKAARRATTSADAAPDGESTSAESTTAESPTAESTTAGSTRAGRQISVTISARGVMKVLAVVVAVAFVVGVALLGWGYRQQAERLAAFDDSKAASEQFAIKLVSTMNSDNVGKMKELLGPLSTGEFRQHLEQQQSEGAKAVADLNVKATPSVQSVSVETFDADSAKTSVLMEVTGTSTLAPDGGKELMLIWLNLRKQDGRWLVEKLDGAQAGIGAPQGEQTRSQGQSAPATPATPAPAG